MAAPVGVGRLRDGDKPAAKGRTAVEGALSDFAEMNRSAEIGNADTKKHFGGVGANSKIPADHKIGNQDDSHAAWLGFRGSNSQGSGRGIPLQRLQRQSREWWFWCGRTGDRKRSARRDLASDSRNRLRPRSRPPDVVSDTRAEFKSRVC